MKQQAQKVIQKIPFSRLRKVQTLSVRFLAQSKPKTSRQGRGLGAQNAASQTFEELDRENADPSTKRNYFRRVFIIHPRDRPLVLPHLDTKVGRFKVSLTLSPSSVEQIRALRQEFLSPGASPPKPLSHVRLLSGTKDTHSRRCEQALIQLARRYSHFELNIGELVKKHGFAGATQVALAYRVVASEVLVALRERVKDVLRQTLDEAHAAEGPRLRSGGEVTKEGYHWKESDFDPWVSICVMTNEEDELLDGILHEVREKFPHGLNLRATGLRMFWDGLSEKGVFGLTKVWEIPFSGSTSGGAEAGG